MSYCRKTKFKDNLVYCTKCKKYKERHEFNESCLKKKYYICNSCSVQYRLQRKSNINRLIDNIYFHQVHKKDAAVKYTWDEFSKCLLSLDEFVKLYNTWIAFECDNQLTPSVIRRNPKAEYSFDNLRVVTARRARELNMHKKDRPIIQMDLDEKEIARFPNARMAAKILEFKQYAGIHKACKGERKTYQGFKWKYA